MRHLLFVLFVLVACSKPVKPAPDAAHGATLAPCLEDRRDDAIAVTDFSVYFDLVADRCAAIPSELRTAAKSSVGQPREQRAKILLAAARKDPRYRPICGAPDAHAAHALIEHPSFDACTQDAAYKLASKDLACTIDIGTYVFLDVLAAHMRDEPGGPWLVEGNKIDMTSIVEKEHRDCPQAKDAGPPRPKPAPVTRTGTVWPFHAWDHGEAVTFNQFGERPGVGLYAYDADGWSQYVVDRKPLDLPLAKHALDLVKSTEGGVDVSKCPFPRHAVILYAGDEPVASINVCFQCGDILVWPPWPGPAIGAPGWEPRHERQLALHKQAFPKWKTFFKDDVGFTVEERQ
jgi:hypothetical protein